MNRAPIVGISVTVSCSRCDATVTVTGTRAALVFVERPYEFRLPVLSEPVLPRTSYSVEVVAAVPFDGDAWGYTIAPADRIVDAERRVVGMRDGAPFVPICPACRLLPDLLHA